MSSITQSEKAYLTLRRRLSRGELAPGTRLVNRTLAHEMGMSFIPVREALSRLASEGLVDHVSGAGTFVRRVNPRELAQLYDVRELFEPFAAAEAARHISPRELEALADVLREWTATGMAILKRKRAPGPKLLNAWIDLDERFHEIIISGSRNPWLAKIMSDLRIVSVCFAAHRQAIGLLTPEIVKRTLRSHDDLLQVLRNGDPPAAEALVRRQLASGREEVLRYFEEETPMK